MVRDCYVLLSVLFSIKLQYNNTSFGTILTPLLYRFWIARLHMLRELEEAVQRKFHVPSDVSDTTGVAYEWESRLHISQVCYSIGSTLI